MISTVRTVELPSQYSGLDIPCVVLAEPTGGDVPRTADFIGTVTAYVGNRYYTVTDGRNYETVWVHRDNILTHADYPHAAGSLYDCPACEVTCHCVDGTGLSGETCLSDECESLGWDEGPDATELADDAAQSTLAGYGDSDLY